MLEEQGQRKDQSREQTIEAPAPGTPSTRLLKAIETRSENAAINEISEQSVKERDVEGRGPLHYAAMRASLPILQALLSAGAVDHADGKGRSALLMACDLPQADLCQALLDAGSNPMIVDALKWTPMTVAIDSNAPACVAALAGKSKEARDRRDGNGFTPARFAIECRNLPCLQALLSAGAKANSYDDEGVELIDAAANSDWPEGVSALAKAGANPRTIHAGDIMEAAAREGRVDLLSAMIDAVASTPGEPIDHELLLQIAEESRENGNLTEEQISALRGALIAARGKWLKKQPLLRKLMERIAPNTLTKAPGAK